MLHYFLFGGVRVQGPDKEELPLSRKQCQALAMLMLSPGSTVASDVLVDFVWREKLPSNPLNSLQDLIKRLRVLLGDFERTIVVTRSGGYGLFVDPNHLDVEVFRKLAGAGLKLEQAEPLAARLLLERALENARGDLPDIAPDFRASERIDDLYHLRSAVVQALSRIDMAEDPAGHGQSDEAFAIWSLGGSPVGMALRISELGELALADLVGTVARFGGRLHQLSRGLLLASFAEGGSALRAAGDLASGTHPAACAIRGGAIRHFESPGPVNDVDRLLELSEEPQNGQIFVSDEVHRAAPAFGGGRTLKQVEGDRWMFDLRDRNQQPELGEELPDYCLMGLLGITTHVQCGSPRLYWGRPVQMAQTLEEIFSGARDAHPS